MTDFSDPSSASLRLSHDERERAVAALQTHAADGRLTDAELQTRVQAARASVTRGDLAPLFVDLPGRVDLDPVGGPHQTAASAGARAGGADSAPLDEHRPPPHHYGRWGLAVVSIVPFISLILFFATSAIWGYGYSWLWFLLVPITGAFVYGTDGDRYRR
ncbi:DUF1707 SHOCT-like domain-containing protein [Leifsonia poae]|uniref:DUF1707 SHOCT-like domain-containing protein n=1 Tax=Leifsonia poae TaxID=110933 RepID=UPI001CC0DD45|nr:DUF1707 domain-containing protein [Leifsonia poae]